MKSLIFVCTANICRSPIAERLLRAKIPAYGSEECDWRVESAGTWALEGEPAARMAQKLLSAHGIDLSDHRSRQVTRELLNQFNLILVMENGHKEAMRIEFPEIAPKTYLLYEMIGLRYEVIDPIGGSTRDFEDTIREIENILTQGFEKISTLVEN
jgi:protein-tyrosine-phosphatase